MKNNRLFIVGVFCLVLASSCQTKSPKIPGSFRSLSDWNRERAFPENNINMRAYSSAFAQLIQEQSRTATFPGQWEAIGPKNFGGRTLCLAFNPQNPNTILAGSASGGLWVSYNGANGAQAWQPVATGFPVLGVAAIAYNPADSNEIYVGTGEVYNYQNTGTGWANRVTRGTYGIGVLKSVDAGATWSKSIDWQYADLRGVQDIVINPLRPATVFAATTEGIYRTYDSGSTWSLVLDKKMATDLHFMPGDTSIIMAAVGNSFSLDPGIYRSTNGGTSFTKLSSGLPTSWSGKALLDVCQTDNAVWYASIADQLAGLGLFRSDNGGLDWLQVNPLDFQTYQGWYSHDVSVNPNNSEDLVTAGIDMYRSLDGGSNIIKQTYWYNWDFSMTNVGGSEGPPDYVHADIHRVYRHPSNGNHVWLATDGGIFRSFDGGDTYEASNGGYQTQQFYQEFSCSNTDSLFAIGGMQDNATAVYEGNLGWRRVIGGDGLSTSIHPTNDQIVYGSSQYLNVDISTDKAQSFGGVSIPGSSAFPNTIFAGPYALSKSNPQVLYAGRSVVYKSTNGGQSFSQTNAGNPLDGNPALSVTINPTDHNDVWVTTAPVVNNTPGIFRTLNGGTAWTNVTANLPNRYYKDVAISPTNATHVLVALSGFGTSHLYQYQTSSATWVAVGSGLPDVPTNSITFDPLNGQIVYVGNDLGAFVSIDGGLNFQPFNDGLIDATMVFDIAVSPSNRKVRLATHGKGVFERDMLPVNITGLPSLSPADWSLMPNPATDYFMVDWSRGSKMQLRVFNANGQMVLSQTVNRGATRVLVDEWTPGIYFVEATADGKSSVKKLLVR
ncbi:MAG: T9SS type A sorting domain-containing protein [Bacteroidota bacterium]